MPQALHGGNIAQAAQEFGVSAGALLDFSANINPFAPGIPVALWERWLTEIVRYPEADAEAIRLKLASVYGVNAASLVPTAGAIEGLYLVARLFVQRPQTAPSQTDATGGVRVGVIEPSFSDYTRAFLAAGLQPEPIALSPDLWNQPAEKWAELLEPYDVVVIGNPNNPTGALQTRSHLAALINRAWEMPKSWIVDEAFMEFVAGGESLLGDLKAYPSLLVLRSLTKSWGIPGLRLGFVATQNPAWIEQLGAMQPPWSINGVAAQWASEFLTTERHQELLMGLAQLREAGVRFAHGLGQILGVKVHRSACNFLLIELTEPEGADEKDKGRRLAQPPLHRADVVYRELGLRGILVRRCDSFYGMPKGRFIRLAVRGDAENNRVLEAFAEVSQKVLAEIPWGAAE